MGICFGVTGVAAGRLIVCALFTSASFTSSGHQVRVNTTEQRPLARDGRRSGASLETRERAEEGASSRDVTIRKQKDFVCTYRLLSLAPSRILILPIQRSPQVGLQDDAQGKEEDSREPDSQK